MKAPFRNVYMLIDKYNINNPSGHFFDADTLKFFGERISDMRISADTVEVTDYYGNTHECIELRSTQRNAPNGTRHAYHYFDIDTWKEVQPREQ